MRVKTTLATAVAAVIALTGAAGSASATGAVPSKPSPSVHAPHHGKRSPQGNRALCQRADRIDKRIAKALERLDGTAFQRGSIAALERRVARAKAAHHDAVKQFLLDHLTYRKSLVPTLRQRRKDLAEVRDWCSSNGHGAST